MGVSRPEIVLVFLGEGEEAVHQIQRFILKKEETVLEIETQIARDLVVAGATGMKPLSGGSNAPGQPILRPRCGHPRVQGPTRRLPFSTSASAARRPVRMRRYSAGESSFDARRLST